MRAAHLPVLLIHIIITVNTGVFKLTWVQNNCCAGMEKFASNDMVADRERRLRLRRLQQLGRRPACTERRR